MARGGKRRFVMVLMLLGGLPLPILAVATGAYIVSHGLFADQAASSLLTSQLLLFATAVLVVGAGGFAIWRTVAALGRATEIETSSAESGGARTVASPPDGPLVNSVSRMLTTIERQASELDQVSQQLDEAHRELESTRARLRETSFIDDVTKLHNRRFLFVRLEEEVARYRRFGRPVSLVLVALDHPLDRKAAGDLNADEMLRHVAEVLAKASRGADVVCRYGADVFSVLLVETAGADARAYAERVNDILLASSFGHEPAVTASLGISTLSEGAGTADDVLRGAEEALQTARRAATHRVAVSAWGEAVPGRAGGQR